MWRYVLTLTATLLMFSGTALAGSQKPSFSQADKNGDGHVSVQEAIQAGVPKASAKVNDLDNDGKLNKEDWKFISMNSMDTGSESGDTPSTSASSSN